MSSLSTSQIKFIRSLSQKKFRNEHGLFIAEGEKIVDEAINSDYIIRDIYKIDEIGEECMARITCLNTPSPVLAIIEQKKEDPFKFVKNLLDSNIDSPDFLALGLDSIKDPGNLGTIIRLSDWFGIDAIFASEQTVELYNPKTIQATMGAIFRKNIIYTQLPSIITQFKERGLDIYGTFLDGSNIYDHKLNNKGMIIMGSESFGISKEIEELVTKKLLIPPYPINSNTSESLNVGVATAIICAEFRRPKA